MIKEKKESWSKKMLEHQGQCYLKGGGCNIPLKLPSNICNFWMYLFSGEELKAKAPPAEPYMLGDVIS